MTPTEKFLAEVDRRGNPLYPGAAIIATHEGTSLVEWFSTASICEGPELRRTWIDDETGEMRPGILGDPEFVHNILIRNSARAAVAKAARARRRNRQKDTSP